LYLLFVTTLLVLKLYSANYEISSFIYYLLLYVITFVLNLTKLLFNWIASIFNWCPIQ